MSLKGTAMTDKVLRGKIKDLHPIEEIEALYTEAEKLLNSLVLDAQLNLQSENPVKNKAISSVFAQLSKNCGVYHPEYDYNGDGVSDENDAIYHLYHTVFPSRYPFPEGTVADIDGDGEITSADSIALLYKFAEGEFIAENIEKKLDKSDFEQEKAEMESAIDSKLNASDYVVDEELTAEGTNPVQGKAIWSILNSLLEDALFPYISEELKKKLDKSKYESDFPKVANVIKGTASGGVVAVDDVSPIPHPISVKVSGEHTVGDSIDSVEEASHNLPQSGFYTVENIELKINDYTEEEGSYITFSNGLHWFSVFDLGDKVSVGDVLYYDKNRTHTDYGTEGALCLTIPFDYTTVKLSKYPSKNYSPKTEYTWKGSLTLTPTEPLKPNTRYLFIADTTTTSPHNALTVYGNTSAKQVYWNTGIGSVLTFTTGEKEEKSFYIHAQKGYDKTNSNTATVKRFVIVEAKEPTTYTPNGDGTVEGIVGNGESITLITDNPDVTIIAEYNADTKKYIDKKFAELQALVLEV